MSHDIGVLPEIGADVKTGMENRGINPDNPAASIGPMIADNKHLKRVLCAVKAKDRRAVYNQLLPHLKFHARPYFLLIK
jgi:hypothetical protein